MKLAPEVLADHGYELLDELDHQEIIPFVRLYLKKRTLASILYIVFNAGFFLAIVAKLWLVFQSEKSSFDAAITHLCYGFAIAFLLIPLHEYIHVLAYKWQGAKNTSYDANIKQFYFMAIADKFVANKQEFQVVALAPFTVISILFLSLLPFVTEVWSFTILGVLLTHTAFCSGDFGLLSYFDFHKDKLVVTYDDKENSISYFYGKSNQGKRA